MPMTHFKHRCIYVTIVWKENNHAKSSYFLSVRLNWEQTKPLPLSFPWYKQLCAWSNRVLSTYLAQVWHIIDNSGMNWFEIDFQRTRFYLQRKIGKPRTLAVAIKKQTKEL